MSHLLRPLTLAVITALGIGLTLTITAQERLIDQPQSAQSVTSAASLSAPADLLYVFSGVTDDGAQGGASRKEATAVHCSNFGTTDAQVEVQLYQFDGATVYTGSTTIQVNRTWTFSTQNTLIYSDDVIVGGNPGTNAISQGLGRILADQTSIVCTAQVLDPLNNPPQYMANLTLFKVPRTIYLPAILKTAV